MALKGYCDEINNANAFDPVNGYLSVYRKASKRLKTPLPGKTTQR